MNKKNPFGEFIRRLLGSVPLQEKINFARHLSVSIKSGMSLIDALKLIQGQSNSKKFSHLLGKVIEDVENGQFLAQSLAKFQYIFGDLFVNMVKVGETSGNLSQSLLYLAGEIKKQREINRRIKGALIYPLIILIATIGVTLFLTLFIFPKILPIFVSLKIQLPFTTQLVIYVLSFLQFYGLYVLGGLVLLFIFGKGMLAVRRIHFLFDRLTINLPFISQVVMNITMTSFTRSLSVLLKSGMTLVDALEIARGTFHNLYYQREIEYMAEGVKKGESMARYLAQNHRIFPPMLTSMIQVGESTGNLEENLAYLSDYYESEVDETLKNLTTILEPVLLLTMGLLVGFIALSIITPIYQVTQGLQIK